MLNVFTDGQNMYEQTESGSMGSCVTPIFAQFFMDSIVRKMLSSPFGKYLVYCKKYVDDFLILFKTTNPSLFSKFIKFSNNLHKNIKFTHESETNQAINFLDITISRNPLLGFSTQLYTKPYANPTPTDWRSNHPKSQKIALVSQIANRICRLTSCKITALKLLGSTHSLFATQHYPKSLIFPMFNKAWLKAFYSSSVIPVSSPKPDSTKWTNVKIPFNSSYNAIAKKWRETSDLIVNNIRTIPILASNTLQLFGHKCDVSDDTNSVYVLVCNQCPKINNQYKVLYVGHSSRKLSARYMSHVQDKNSPINAHLSATNHTNIKIIPIMKVPSVNERVFVEALFIKILKPPLNIYSSTPTILRSSNVSKSEEVAITRKVIKIINKFMSDDAKVKPALVRRTINHSRNNQNKSKTPDVLADVVLRRSARSAARKS